MNSVDVVIATRNIETISSRLMQSIETNIPVSRLILVTPQDDGGKGIGIARQIGLSRVKTLLHVVIDDDILEVPGGWFEAAIQVLLDPHVAVVTAAPIYGPGTLLGKYYHQRYVVERRFTQSPCLACMRTEAIRQVGWRSVCGGEDLLLSLDLMAAGYKWVVLYDRPVYHPRTFLKELKAQLWWSQGRIHTGEKPWYALLRIGGTILNGVYYGMFLDVRLLFMLPLLGLVWAIGFLKHYSSNRIHIMNGYIGANFLFKAESIMDVKKIIEDRLKLNNSEVKVVAEAEFKNEVCLCGKLL